MKIMTSQLTGLALDWLLLSLSEPDELFHLIRVDGVPQIWHDSDVGTHHPTLNGAGQHRFIRMRDGVPVSLFGNPQEPQTWGFVGPIIDRKRIDIRHRPAPWCDVEATCRLGSPINAFGSTPLIAAIRCFVASELGDEIDIPEKLLEDRLQGDAEVVEQAFPHSTNADQKFARRGC